MENVERIIARFSEAQDSLVLQASDLSLETIAAMVEKDAIDIEPHFQRRERWSSEAQSSLIESFLLNVPVPPVYLAEDDYGTYSVIDGKQRITAIRAFMRNELVLKGLEAFSLIDGARFEDLPPPLQNALEVRPYLRVVTLLKQSDSELKYEVFTRLNKGGEELNAQEIRNVAFRGDLNDLIYDLAEDDFLRDRLKIRSRKSSAYRKMKDAEMVLRYFALLDGWKEFSGDYRRSMDEFMKKKSGASAKELSVLRDHFETSIRACEQIWGDVAFKRADGFSWRDQMLSGMYDAQMIAVSEVSEATLSGAIANREDVIELTHDLFDDPDFDEAVRRATNNPGRMEYRITAIRDLLEQVG